MRSWLSMLRGAEACAGLGACWWKGWKRLFCSLLGGTWRFGSIFLFSGFAKKKCPVFWEGFQTSPGTRGWTNCLFPQPPFQAFGKPPKIVPPEIAPHPDWDDFSVVNLVPGWIYQYIRKIGNRYIKDQTKTIKCQQIYSNIHMDPLSLLCP